VQAKLHTELASLLVTCQAFNSGERPLSGEEVLCDLETQVFKYVHEREAEPHEVRVHPSPVAVLIATHNVCTSGRSLPRKLFPPGYN
jgi:hypothetical protein